MKTDAIKATINEFEREYDGVGMKPAVICEARAELAALEADNAAMRADDYRLRAMLAFRCAGPSLYGDDGELQDCSVLPHIDFKNDSPSEISRKLIKRANDKLIAERALTPDSGKTTPAINSATGSGIITEINLWRDGPKKYRTPEITIEEGDLINWDDTGFEIVRDGVTVRRVELSECELVSHEPDSGKVLVDVEKLREIEHGGDMFCPSCGGGYPLHADDCWIDAVLKDRP